MEKLNVYTELKNIEIYLNKGQINIALKYFNRLIDFLKSIKDQPNLQKYNLNEILTNCLDVNESNIQNKLNSLKEDLKKAFSHPIIFFTRHPQPDPMNYSENQSGRILTSLGVEQSKKFAEAILNDLLIAPYEKINVHVFYTSKTRTQMLAQITQKTLETNFKDLKKQFNFYPSSENNKFLYPLTVQELLETLKMNDLLKMKGAMDEIKVKGANTQNTETVVGYFEIWVKTYPSSKTYSQRLRKVIERISTRKLNDSLEIYLLFSHETGLAAFTYNELSKDAPWPYYTDYIKLINIDNKFNYLYKEKWY